MMTLHALEKNVKERKCNPDFKTSFHMKIDLPVKLQRDVKTV